jgi:hypothetical protein
MRMPTDDLWITARITDACKRHPSVTEAVSARFQELVKGQLSERQLTQVELGSVAKALIEDMGPASPKAQAKQ